MIFFSQEKNDKVEYEDYRSYNSVLKVEDLKGLTIQQRDDKIKTLLAAKEIDFEDNEPLLIEFSLLETQDLLLDDDDIFSILSSIIYVLASYCPPVKRQKRMFTSEELSQFNFSHTAAQILFRTKEVIFPIQIVVHRYIGKISLENLGESWYGI